MAKQADRFAVAGVPEAQRPVAVPRQDALALVGQGGTAHAIVARRQCQHHRLCLGVPQTHGAVVAPGQDLPQVWRELGATYGSRVPQEP